MVRQAAGASWDIYPRAEAPADAVLPEDTYSQFECVHASHASAVVKAVPAAVWPRAAVLCSAHALAGDANRNRLHRLSAAAGFTAILPSPHERLCRREGTFLLQLAPNAASIKPCL